MLRKLFYSAECQTIANFGRLVFITPQSFKNTFKEKFELIKKEI